MDIERRDNVKKRLDENVCYRLAYQIHTIQLLTIFLLSVNNPLCLVGDNMARMFLVVGLEFDGYLRLPSLALHIRLYLFKEHFSIFTRQYPLMSRCISFVRNSFAVGVSYDTAFKSCMQPFNDEGISISQFNTQTVRGSAKFSFSVLASGHSDRDPDTSFTIHQTGSIGKDGTWIIYMWDVCDGKFLASHPLYFRSMKAIDVLSISLSTLNDYLFFLIFEMVQRVSENVRLALNRHAGLMMLDSQVGQYQDERLLSMDCVYRPFPGIPPAFFGHTWLSFATLCIPAKCALKPFNTGLIGATHIYLQAMCVVDTMSLENSNNGDTALSINEASGVSQGFTVHPVDSLQGTLLYHECDPIRSGGFRRTHGEHEQSHHLVSGHGVEKGRALYRLNRVQRAMLVWFLFLYSCHYFTTNMVACQARRGG